MYSFPNFPFLETSPKQSPHSSTFLPLNTTSQLPKKSIPLNEPYLHNLPPTKRKFTLEPSLNIKDFVPKLKPLQIHFVPSKLRLNPNNYNDYNNINQQHISCPNTDESESISSENDDDNDTEQYVHLKVTNQMKNLRKIMKRFKHNNVMKVFSKEVICNKKFDNDNNEDTYLNDNDLYSDNNDNDNEYYNEENYILDGLSKNNNNNNNNKERNKIKRVNSCSILQLLESNLNMNII